MQYGKQDYKRMMMIVKEEDTMWICGVSIRFRLSSELRSGMGLKCIEEVMHNKRLRWFEHLERSGGDSWINRCRNYPYEGQARRAEP